MSEPMNSWETVIGLEVHAELRTATKLFCGCRNAFGDAPNTNVCAVCLGLPGSLPVLNRAAVELAMRIGIALHCEIRPSIFHRKNYFYPDMPKDFQISQYDEPINVDGWLELPDAGRVGIVRAHIEEDTGKTTHVGGGGRIHEAAYSLVDYNRAGVPLVEIVSAPDIRSARQARAYVEELRGILVATGASDGKMEEGSLRVDCNVSMRRQGSDDFGTRCEVKNMNSLRSLARAVEFETRRQIEVLEGGGSVAQETRHWDEDVGATHGLRSKEEAEDYRYFPEPDLVPLAPSTGWVEGVRSAMPPLPADRRSLLAAAAPGVSTDAVATVVAQGLDALVTAAIDGGGDPKLAINRAANEVAASGGAGASLDPAAFTKLVVMEGGRQLTSTQAKDVLAEMLSSGGDPAAIASARGYEALPLERLSEIIDEMLAAHPTEATKLAAGDQKVVGFFIGKVMQATDKRADGKVVTDLLRAKASPS